MDVDVDVAESGACPVNVVRFIKATTANGKRQTSQQSDRQTTLPISIKSSW